MSRHLGDLAEGDTIILVPGIDGTAQLFYRQMPLLAERFNVVAFPLRDDADATMATLIEDLRVLITEVAPDGAVLLGESFGGALSMSFALAHRELVKGLVIINSFPWLRNRPQLHVGRILLRLIPSAAMPHIRRGTASRMHSRHTNADDLAEFWKHTDDIDQIGYRSRLGILGRYDIRHRLREIVAPTLLLAADEDKLIPSVRCARYMHERIPNSSMTVLAGYGNICLITHDLDLRTYVLPWWDRQPEAAIDPSEGFTQIDVSD